MGAAVVVAVFVWGCATPRSTAPSANLPVAKGGLADKQAAGKEIEDARRMIESGDTSTVIPRLLNTISKYPSSKAALDARYWLAVAYYKIGGYRDAINLFNEYLELAPEGTYAAEAKQFSAQLSDEYDQKYPSPEKLASQIQAATENLQANPNDLPSKLELADLLWRRGEYDKAGALYKSIVDRNRQLANDATIKSRVEFLTNGQYVVLTPSELQRRQIEAQPLEVINTNAFRSGPDLFTQEKRFYAVTGQVVNKSDSVLYGVEVIVTIYGFGSIVYDTSTVAIPRLNPGEIRAFSVRFTNFDNIENVNRYDCVATFQR